MLGLHDLPDTPSRMARLSVMDLPDILRDDVRDLLLPAAPVTTAAPASGDKKPMPRLATRKPQNRRL